MAKKTGKKRTLGLISDEILDNKNLIATCKKDIEGYEERIRYLETELQALATKQGLTKGGGSNSTFKIEPVTVPQAVNWDEIYTYIYENKYGHLLHRRLGSKACEELWALGQVIPGIEKFTSNKVTVKGVD